MADFIPGQRYPLTHADAAFVMRCGRPLTYGIPDLRRGRLFLKAPGDWVFWMTDGRRTEFAVIAGGGYIVSQGKEPDPNRPEPLEAPVT